MICFPNSLPGTYTNWPMHKNERGKAGWQGSSRDGAGQAGLAVWARPFMFILV